MKKQLEPARTSPLSLTIASLRSVRGGDGTITRADDEDDGAARVGYDIKVNKKV